MTRRKANRLENMVVLGYVRWGAWTLRCFRYEWRRDAVCIRSGLLEVAERDIVLLCSTSPLGKPSEWSQKWGAQGMSGRGRLRGCLRMEIRGDRQSINKVQRSFMIWWGVGRDSHAGSLHVRAINRGQGGREAGMTFVFGIRIRVYSSAVFG